MGRSFGGERLSIDYARLPGSTLEQRRKAIECENILVDILKFDGFFGANFDILKPKWIPTLSVERIAFAVLMSELTIGGFTSTTVWPFACKKRARPAPYDPVPSIPKAWIEPNARAHVSRF